MVGSQTSVWQSPLHETVILTFSKSVHPSVVSASAETTDGHEDHHLSVQPELQLGSSRQDTFGIEA